MVAKKNIEDGRKIRTDCTVVESNIHHPIDLSLLKECQLEDCVSVFSRLTSRAMVRTRKVPLERDEGRGLSQIVIIYIYSMIKLALKRKLALR